MPETSKTVDAALTCKICKVDTERRLVVAWASVTTAADGSPVIDHQGDVIEIDTLEDAVNKAFAGGGLPAGDMHRSRAGRVVQALTVSKAEREALGFGLGQEGLVVKLHIEDDATWARVRSGELRELSIGGTAHRVEMAA